MRTVNRSAIVPYTDLEMYQLVADVKSYPDFLPWCGRSEISKESSTEVEATLEFSLGALRKSFTTRNEMQEPSLIAIRLLDGPFKHLIGDWTFERINAEACKVELKMEFEFSNKMMSYMLEPMFYQIANSLVDAFCKRATTVYGPREI